MFRCALAIKVFWKCLLALFVVIIPGLDSIGLELGIVEPKHIHISHISIQTRRCFTVSTSNAVETLVLEGWKFNPAQCNVVYTVYDTSMPNWQCKLLRRRRLRVKWASNPMRNTFAHAPLAEAPAIQHHHQKGPEKFLNIEDVQSLSFWAIFFHGLGCSSWCMSGQSVWGLGFEVVERSPFG